MVRISILLASLVSGQIRPVSERKIKRNQRATYREVQRECKFGRPSTNGEVTEAAAQRMYKYQQASDALS